MSYVYHVHFSQTLADGRGVDSDATLTLDLPIQYVSDLDLVKRLIVDERPGQDVVIKSWRLLMGKQRPVAIPSTDGLNGPRVEFPAIDLDSPGEPISLVMKREPWAPPVTASRLVAGRRMAPQEWAQSDAFGVRYKPAYSFLADLAPGCINSNPSPDCRCFVCGLSRPAFRHGAQLGRNPEHGLDALRYSPDLQAQGERSNSCLMDGLAHVREATDYATASARAAQVVLDLETFTRHGLVPESTVHYLRMIAGALHLARQNMAPEVTP